MGKRNWELLFNEYIVSFWEDEKVVEMNTVMVERECECT